MISTIRRAFSKDEVDTPAEKPAPLRPSAIVRAELEQNRGALVYIDESIERAESELKEVRQRFDQAMNAWDGHGQHPSRAELDQATGKTNALYGARAAKAKLIQQLTAELAETETAEAIARDNDHCSDLIARATAVEADLETAIAKASAVEEQLFKLLYSTTSGLKRVFATPELNRQAEQARRQLSRSLQAHAQELHHAVDDRFDACLDGNHNFGLVEGRFWHGKNGNIS